MDLGLTVTDVWRLLTNNGAEGDSNYDAIVSELILDHQAIVAAYVDQIGLESKSISPTATDYVVGGPKHKLFRLLRRIVILYCAADLQEALSHEESKLSKGRRERADSLLSNIRSIPEGILEDWDGDRQTGSWEYDSNANCPNSGEGTHFIDLTKTRGW